MSDNIKSINFKEDFEKLDNKPSTIEEFREKYEKVLIENTNDPNMVTEFFDILEELASANISAFRSQFERLFHHMQKYQYQPELQSPSWIRSMTDASRELSDLSSEAKQIWNRLNMTDLNKYYCNARAKTLDKCDPGRVKYLNGVIPETIPYEYTKENCTSRNFIKAFCNTYVNHNLPEMERYVDNMR